MKKILFTLLLISVSFLNCNPELISVYKNDKDNSTTYRLQTGYMLGRTGTVVLQPCGTVNPEKVVRNDSIFYNLVVDCWSDEYYEINTGRSLLMSLDGLVISFDSPEGGANNKSFSSSKWGRYSEKAWYPVTAEDLKKIASSKKVLLRIKGLKRELLGEYEPDGFENFKQFVKEQVQ
jgi:hypothetical protein